MFQYEKISKLTKFHGQSKMIFLNRFLSSSQNWIWTWARVSKFPNIAETSSPVNRSRRQWQGASKFWKKKISYFSTKNDFWFDLNFLFSQKLTWLFFKFWFSEAAVRFVLFEYSVFLISCSEKIPYYYRFLELRMELLRYFDPKINSKFNFLHFETTTMAFEAYIPLKLKYHGHVW